MKLVRDNIPDIIKKDTGREPTIMRLYSRDDKVEFLIRKLQEEADELALSTDNNMTEELVDIIEAADALREIVGPADVDRIRRAKAEKKGTFKTFTVLRDDD